MKFFLYLQLLFISSVLVLSAQESESAATAVEAGDSAWNVARPALGSVFFYTSDRVPDFVSVALTPDVLVADDKTLRYPLPKGRSIMLVELLEQAEVTHVTFFNYHSEATVRASVAVDRAAADGGNWVDIADGVSISGLAPVRIDVPADQGPIRCVRLVFESEGGGDVGGVGVGGSFLSDKAPRMADLVRVDRSDQPLTSVVAPGSPARVVATNGGAENFEYMVDELVDTYYVASTGESPAAVLLDLGEQREVQRVSVLADGPAGEIDVFFLNEASGLIPEDQSAAVTAASFSPAGSLWGMAGWALPLSASRVFLVDPGTFTSDLPSVSLVLSANEAGVGRDIEPRLARYVLFVWRNAGPTKIYELCVLGRYRWDWGTDRPVPGAVQSATFAPPSPPPDFPNIIPVSP